MSKTFKTWHKIGKTLQLPYANEKKIWSTLSQATTTKA